MVRGRKAKTPEQAEKDGYYKRHPERQNKDASKADGKEPRMPDFFTEEEKQVWMRTIDDMRRMGSLSSDLGQIIEAYVVAYASWISTRRRIAADGEVVTFVKTGGETDHKRHPLLPDLHKYRDQANKLLPELGLAPTQRNKYSPDKPKEEDPFEVWLAQATGAE